MSHPEGTPERPARSAVPVSSLEGRAAAARCRRTVRSTPSVRPEWITCIRRNQTKAWCGNSALTFTFMDAEHAINNHANEGRLTTCPECARAVADAVVASVVA